MDFNNRATLQAYVESHPGSQLAPRLANILLQDQEIEQSLMLIRTVLESTPQNSIARFVYAKGLIQQGESRAAIEQLQHLLLQDPGFLQANYLLLEIGQEQLELTVLQSCYQRILVLNPGDAEICQRLESLKSAATLSHPWATTEEPPNEDFVPEIPLSEVQEDQPESSFDSVDDESILESPDITESFVEPELPDVGFESLPELPPEPVATEISASEPALEESTIPASVPDSKPDVILRRPPETDLRVPVPTITLAKVLKKQKLYEQALQILNMMEERSKDLEKVRQLREEILQLQEANGEA
jgi:tetratricopeptide (TPR) repeat protein